jgi:hypothetical protein
MLDIIDGASYSKLTFRAGFSTSPLPQSLRRARGFFKAESNFLTSGIDHAVRRQVEYGKAKSEQVH